MTIEMEDFLYELRTHAELTHTFKDAFERLSPKEREKVLALAPSEKAEPTAEYEAILAWLDEVRQHFGKTD